MGSGTGSQLSGHSEARVKRANPESRNRLRIRISDSGSGALRRPGMTEQRGLQPPPDNSFERRADRRGEHTARKSVVKGFDEAPQRGYVARAPLDINAELRKALGYDSDPTGPLTGGDPNEEDEASQRQASTASPLPSPLWGEVGGGGPSSEAPTSTPLPNPLPQGGRKSAVVWKGRTSRTLPKTETKSPTSPSRPARSVSATGRRRSR